MLYLLPQFSLPETIATDNGTQFTSQDVSLFLKSKRIVHITSAPYHPATNGLAEKAVLTFKNGLKKLTNGFLQHRLTKLLFQYQCTPQMTIYWFVACRTFIGRRLRFYLPGYPRLISKRVENNQKDNHDAHIYAYILLGIFELDSPG